ncbi:MAG: transporter substrate-binding domain-containing protein [Phycisphaerales bacterium]
MKWRSIRPGLSFVLSLCAVVALSSTSVDAQPETESLEAAEPLVVGTKSAPPFAIQRADGEWEGITIELWERIAADLGLTFEYVERDLDQLIEGVRGGSLDIAAAALTITPEREATLDFTHPFYSTGLGIAVINEGRSGWLALVQRFISMAFLKAVLALTGVLLIIGFVLWVFERRRNAEQFGGTAAEGLGNSFWWAAVTMTTVGYGDKAPVTVPGRLVALVWMFASIIVISGFTAAIASALTVGQLEGSISGPDDLPGLTVGVVRDSTSEAYLRSRGVARDRYDDPQAALEALREGTIDAVVHDRPVLQYLAQEKFSGELRVIPGSFQRQDYGFALPQQSEWREPLNQAILEQLVTPEWTRVVERYLGEKP